MNPGATRDRDRTAPSTRRHCHARNPSPAGKRIATPSPQRKDTA